MGSHITRPLRDYSSTELADTIETHLGALYSDYAESIKLNAVDGKLLEGMSEAEFQETLNDLNILNRLHCRVLTKEWHTCTESSFRSSISSRSSIEAAAEYDVTPDTPAEELKEFGEIAELAFEEFGSSVVYAGVHLVDPEGHVALSSLLKNIDGNIGKERFHQPKDRSQCYAFVMENDEDFFSRGLYPSLRKAGETHTYISHVVKTKTGERIGAVCILCDDSHAEDKRDILRRLAAKAQEQLELRKVLIERNKMLRKQIGQMTIHREKSSATDAEQSYSDQDDDDVLLPATGPLKAVKQSQVENRASLVPMPDEIDASGTPRRSAILPIIQRNQATPNEIEEMEHIPPDYYKTADAMGMKDRIPIPKGDRERAAAVEALGLRDLDPSSQTAISIQGLVELASSLFGMPYVEVTFQNHDTNFGLARVLPDERQAQLLKMGCEPVNYDLQGRPYLCKEPRCTSVCNYVAVAGSTFVIHDSSKDESFDFVKDLQWVAFYSGAPIVVHGKIVAALCIMDFRARPDFTKANEVQQEQIAKLISREIENWSLRREMEQLEKARIQISSHKDKDMLPEGEVAIVLTDVQGSTSLWEANADAMQQALNLHDQIMRDCCALNHGYEIATAGDAFEFAFHDSLDAIQFALTVQLQLHNAPWSDEILALPDACSDGHAFRGLRVRMGIHVGGVNRLVNEVSGRTEYTGQTYYIAKSLEQMCHGGQILVSQDAWRAASYLAEMELGSPQVIDVGTHVLRTGKNTYDGMISKPVVQLVPATLSFDYFAQSQCIENGNEPMRRRSSVKGILHGRRFPPLKTKQRLSSSFYEAPRTDNNVVTISFIDTSEMEEVYEDPAVMLATLAKLVSSLLEEEENEGYQCKNTMLAFASSSTAIKFGLKLIDVLKDKLVDDKDVSALIKIGVHEGVFTSMGPHQTTGRAEYFGKVVNRAARIAAASKPGHVCLGVASTSETKPELGPGLELTLMGRETLRGVQEVMDLYTCSLAKFN